MTARVVETAPPRAKLKSRPATQSFARFRAPFALRCGSILIDYIILMAILCCSLLVSRLLGGGARSAGNASETVGMVLAVVVAALDLGVLPGLTGVTAGKWATGLRILRADGRKSELDVRFCGTLSVIRFPLLLLVWGFWRPHSLRADVDCMI